MVMNWSCFFSCRLVALSTWFVVPVLKNLLCASPPQAQPQVYQPAIFRVPNGRLGDRSYLFGTIPIEIVSAGNSCASFLIFGVLKPPCQSCCDGHSIWLAIETVHIFRSMSDRIPGASWSKLL
jgi:hypothetical protein